MSNATLQQILERIKSKAESNFLKDSKEFIVEENVSEYYDITVDLKQAWKRERLYILYYDPFPFLPYGNNAFVMDPCHLLDYFS